MIYWWFNGGSCRLSLNTILAKWWSGWLQNRIIRTRAHLLKTRLDLFKGKIELETMFFLQTYSAASCICFSKRLLGACQLYMFTWPSQVTLALVENTAVRSLAWRQQQLTCLPEQIIHQYIICINRYVCISYMICIYISMYIYIYIYVCVYIYMRVSPWICTICTKGERERDVLAFPWGIFLYHPHQPKEKTSGAAWSIKVYWSQRASLQVTLRCHQAWRAGKSMRNTIYTP